MLFVFIQWFFHVPQEGAHILRVELASTLNHRFRTLGIFWGERMNYFGHRNVCHVLFELSCAIYSWRTPIIQIQTGFNWTFCQFMNPFWYKYSHWIQWNNLNVLYLTAQGEIHCCLCCTIYLCWTPLREVMLSNASCIHALTPQRTKWPACRQECCQSGVAAHRYCMPELLLLLSCSKAQIICVWK